MRKVIGLLLILGAFWGVKQLINHYQSVKEGQLAEGSGGPPARVDSTVLPGLPPALEPSLQTARKQGAPGLGRWLKTYRPYVTDPRLADIELDYVVSIGAGNIQEARRIFAAVKQRTPTNSPVYPRLKQLEKTYR
jgi:hypothetical protein